MITEFLGILNLPEADKTYKLIKKNAAYQVPCCFNQIEFFEGLLSNVSIGSDIPRKILIEDELILSGDISVYNRDALIKELVVSAENLTDEELLLKAFRKWDRNLVNHIRGDFAFAIWNCQKKELLCARDHFGIRPFYYSLINDGIIFGSELSFPKAGFKERNPELNPEYFLDTLVTMISDRHITAFKNIYRLPPAHVLLFKDGKTKLECYWQPDPVKKIRFMNEDDYTNYLKEILIKAVEDRCRGAQSVGSELSGGLDSSAVTCLSADFTKKNNTPFHAFSNTLPDNHNTNLTDEKEHILKILSYKNIPWHEVNSIDSSIPGIVQHALNAQSCFTQQRFHMFNQGVFEAARKYETGILLSGFGGDEMVSARTGFSYNDLIDEKQWKHLFKALGKDNQNIPIVFLKGLKQLLKYYFQKNRNLGTTSGVFSPDMLNKRFNNLALNKEYSEKHKLKERYFTKHQRQKHLFLAFRQSQKINHQHVPQRLEYSYAAAAQYGIQYRYPLFDPHLVQSYLSFPAWVKHKPSEDRYMFRQIIKNVVPEEIRFRKDKSGTVIPYIGLKLITEKKIVLERIENFSHNKYLNQIFDFSKFDGWLNDILEKNEDEMNFLMPGAFYNYLMIMMYFNETE